MKPTRRVLAAAAAAGVLVAARRQVWAAWLPHRERLAAAGLLPALCQGCTKPVTVWGGTGLASRFCRTCIVRHFASTSPGHHCAVCPAARAD